jgi:hypothetical protein
MSTSDLGVSLLDFNVTELKKLLVVSLIGEVVGGNPRGPLVYVDTQYTQKRILQIR